MIKVLHVVKALEKNGVTSVIMSYSRHIDRSEFQMDIVTGTLYRDEYKQQLIDDGCQFYSIPNRDKNILGYILELKKIILQGNYDIVHVHGNSSMILPELFSAKISGVKFRIAHSHNTMCSHPAINKVLFPLFDLCVTNRIACSSMAGVWMFRKKKFKVLNNSIDTSIYTYNADNRFKVRKSLNIPDDAILVGHIGYFNYQKNQERLISIFEAFRKKMKAKIILIGDGDNRSNIEELICKKNLNEDVLVLGIREDVPDLLSAMDIFVLPSRYEGLGIVLLEAQANGMKCVTSDVVPKEANGADGVTYISLENSDAEWAEAIINNIVTDRLSNSLVQRRRLIERGFDTTTLVEELQDYYKSMES